MGYVYKNEIFQTLRKGQVIPGFIQERCGRTARSDVCIHKPGPEKVDAMSEKIIEILKAQGGSIAVSDNSSPEVIYRLFGVSKKTYKKAIGGLYKKRLIVIESDSIKLSVGIDHAHAEKNNYTYYSVIPREGGNQLFSVLV